MVNQCLLLYVQEGKGLQCDFVKQLWVVSEVGNAVLVTKFLKLRRVLEFQKSGKGYHSSLPMMDLLAGQKRRYFENEENQALHIRFCFRACYIMAK